MATINYVEASRHRRRDRRRCHDRGVRGGSGGGTCALVPRRAAAGHHQASEPHLPGLPRSETVVAAWADPQGMPGGPWHTLGFGPQVYMYYRLGFFLTPCRRRRVKKRKATACTATTQQLGREMARRAVQ